MDEILDDNYAKDIKQLKFGAQGTGMLAINFEEWKEEFL